MVLPMPPTDATNAGFMALAEKRSDPGYGDVN